MRRWNPLLHAEVLHFQGRGDRERGRFVTGQSAVDGASRGQHGTGGAQTHRRDADKLRGRPILLTLQAAHPVHTTAGPPPRGHAQSRHTQKI